MDEIKRALQRAAGDPQPDTRRLLDAVPQIIAEAARRREHRSAPDAEIVRVGRTWLPRLAAATTLLAILAFWWPARQSNKSAAVEASSPTVQFASLLVPQEIDSTAPNPLLVALTQ